MSQTQNNNAFALLSDVIEKVIDAETTSTKAIESLKGLIDKLIDSEKTNAENVQLILAQFRNGFKKELKDHTDAQLESKARQIIEEIIENRSATNQAKDEVLELLQAHHGFAEDMLVSMEKLKTELIVLLDELKKEIDKFHSFGFWAKVVFGAIIGIGSIAALVLKLHSSVQH